jgi:SET domain-containing protein
LNDSVNAGGEPITVPAAENRVAGLAEAHPAYVVRQSSVHGYGAFAIRDIAKGEVIDEYAGERITHAQANERYASRDINDNHTFLLTLDDHYVIDGGYGGNDTRFLNHKCDPNCETVTREGRVFIVALRAIRAGEELGFEYNIGREDDDPENVDEIYACRCGSPKCRGTILWPPQRPKPRRRKTKKS